GDPGAGGAPAGGRAAAPWDGDRGLAALARTVSFARAVVDDHLRGERRREAHRLLHRRGLRTLEEGNRGPLVEGGRAPFDHAAALHLEALVAGIAFDAALRTHRQALARHDAPLDAPADDHPPRVDIAHDHAALDHRHGGVGADRPL